MTRFAPPADKVVLDADDRGEKKTRRNAFRQCDVERAIRAAQATNAGIVVVRPDGSLVIEPRPNEDDKARAGRTAKPEDYVL